MWENEATRFLSLFTVLLLVLITGIILFIFEYRRRVVLNEKEKTIMNEKFAKELLQTQLEVQQQTMQYIGREIHDSVGQKLTLAALYAQQIDYEKKHPQISERIVAVSNIINESLSELRSLSKSLTSDYIADTDLITLIKNECDKINAARTCAVHFNSNTKNVITSYHAKNIITRIVQEFLQNCLKHAACSVIEVQTEQAVEGLTITITDNGKGFSESELPGKGIGLLNIKKRAAAIGANAVIESKAGHGTRLALFIPFHPHSSSL